MSELKGFRISDEDKWNKFVSIIKANGQTIGDKLNELIDHEIRKSEPETRTTSNYVDLFTQYLVTLNLSDVIKKGRYHVTLDQKDHYYFIESAGHQIKQRLSQALGEALRLYWCWKYASRKNLTPEQTTQLETKWNMPKLEGFRKVCNSIKITYDCPVIPKKAISDFTIQDLNKILVTDVTVIGSSGRKFDTIKQDYAQKILVQELEQDAKNNNPMILKAILWGEHSVGSGQKIRMLGRYRLTEPENGKATSNQIPLFFEIFDILPITENSKYELSEQEIRTAFEVAKHDEVFYLNSLVDSFAPHIHGRDLEKQAIILSILSGCEMGANRNESHLMLIGEADTGKSELVKFCSKILSNCGYVDGANATGQSLGFALDEYDGTKVLRAGALIQHNNGVLVIDEYDKMPKSEQKKLNRAMEQQTVKYDKGGHDAIAEAKTTIIAACNPTNERWNENIPIVDNFPFDPSTLTRYDLVIRLSHDYSEQKSRKKIKHIFQYMNGENRKLLDAKYLGALLEFLKKRKPKFTKEAELTLENFYVKLKNLEQKDGALTIETRQMLGLIRICKAYAKLVFADEVDMIIVNKVIEIYKKCLNTLGMITDTQMQIDLRGQSINKDEFFTETFMSLAGKDKDGIVLIQELTDKLLENTKFFKTERAVIAYLNQKKQEGYCYEPHVGRLKRI